MLFSGEYNLALSLSLLENFRLTLIIADVI